MDAPVLQKSKNHTEKSQDPTGQKPAFCHS